MRAPFTLPTPGSAPDLDPLMHMFEICPGGQHLKPHHSDGPYQILLLHTWYGPNWQAAAALMAHPPVAMVPFFNWSFESTALLVMPQYCADLVGWHVNEGDLDLHREASSPLLDERPDAAAAVRHLASAVRADESGFLEDDERERYAASLEAALTALGGEATLAVLTQISSVLGNAGDLSEDEALETITTMLAAMHHERA